VIKKNDNIVLHVDVNSAFLSWSAVEKLRCGEEVDIRNVPSVIGGDESRRHGVVLAKSVPAKKFGIVTGESLYSARQKCPNLLVVTPDFSVYRRCSHEMMCILREYTPDIEQFSIDECFLGFPQSIKEKAEELGYSIKDRIKKELGFTVNVGVSCNKLLAKMASELKKPDMLHSLFPEEIKDKMWPLPIEELFMVGKRTAERLRNLNINTIGDLALYDVDILQDKFKSYGRMIWKYANGVDESKVEAVESEMKVISNSVTIPTDVRSKEEAYSVLMSLSENIGRRLRKDKKCCRSISVSIRNSDFVNYSHQKKLINPTDSDKTIFETAKGLFDNAWKHEPIRLLGVAASQLGEQSYYQVSLFGNENIEKKKSLDSALDKIRNKYGEDSVKKSIQMNQRKEYLIEEYDDNQ
jgi:DNA polymerase IV